MTRLTECIAPAFYPLHTAIKNAAVTHIIAKGGRMSTKSSWAALEIVLGIMSDKDANAVCLRKVKDTCAESVYEQCMWAIEKMGVTELWRDYKSPLKIVYKATGQAIIFRGADKPKKVKSAKLRRGYIKYIWYEEVDEFFGMAEIRMLNQTFMRGGPQFFCLMTYNPPKSPNSWMNVEAKLSRPDRIVHTSDYRSVPRDWLGNTAIREAEHLKDTNYDAYRHEYLAHEIGTGGQIFTKLKIRRVSDEEIEGYDLIRRGLDFGFTPHPMAQVDVYYNKNHKRIVVFREIYQAELSNARAIDLIKANGLRQPLYADSAEPKSIAEYKANGIAIYPAIKGPDSIDYGIKFLQDLHEIIIDDVRCPNTAQEFLHYELDKDNKGHWKAGYPDRNNHSIDAVRYAMEQDMRKSGIRFVSKRNLSI